MKEKKADLLQGTLDLLVLKALALGPLLGLGVSRRIEQITKGTFQVKPGSLFPSLHRMEEAGWLRAEWVTKDRERRLRVYRLTVEGGKQLSTEESRWQTVTSAVNRVLRTVGHVALVAYCEYIPR